MQTYNEKVGDNDNIKGAKHWQGLTRMADYWLITSRKKNASVNLNRSIFFICDINQQIIVDEYYDNLGLYMIPYVKNIVDIQVTSKYKLEPHSSSVKTMLDILHRSRLQFPIMALGFLKIMLDESITYCSERSILKLQKRVLYKVS